MSQHYPGTTIPKQPNIALNDLSTWVVRVERQGQSRYRFIPIDDDLKESFGLAKVAKKTLIRELGEAQYRTDHLQEESAKAKQWASATRTGVKGLGFTMERRKRWPEPRLVIYYFIEDSESGKRKKVSLYAHAHGLKGALRIATTGLWAENQRAGRDSRTARSMFSKALPRIIEFLANYEPEK